MRYQRILTVQDISCVGQCSTTVALPILSACGHETVILPTAVLSSHTGGFEAPYIRDLTEDVPAICDRWKNENIDFDVIYTGYLGSIREIELVSDILDTMKAKNGKTVVDPAMADHGKLYKGFYEEYAASMAALCKKADLIIPNITEAAMMTGLPYREHYDEDYICRLMESMDAKAVVLTGVSYRDDETGVAICENGVMSYYKHERIGKSYHGTGDIFASALVGAWAGGMSIQEAAAIAAEFTYTCIAKTYQNPAHWYGVKFERALPKLISLLQKD